MLNKILNEMVNDNINEADGPYPSLEKFLDEIGMPMYHIDNVIGITNRILDACNKDFRNNLFELRKLLENPAKLQKDNAAKSKVKSILYSMKSEGHKFKNIHQDAENLKKHLVGLVPLFQACETAKQLYNELK